MELHGGLCDGAGGLCVAAGGRVLGWVCFGLVRYVLWVAGVLASAPGHAVYFSNGFLKYWLLYVYAMFGGCLLTRIGGGSTPWPGFWRR